MKNNFITKNIVNSKSPYIIAEIGINHNGNLELAKKMIKAAKKSGAHCVKFQKFIANNYISKFAQKASYQKNDKKVSQKSQLEIIKSCELSISQLKILKKFSEKLKVDFLCTPFEIDSLKELIKIKISAIKISSCNLNNIPFLLEAAKSKLPILLSTGMGNLQEVKDAVKIFKRFKNPLLVFQCTSNYPSNIKNANISVLTSYQKLFKCPVGFSDHTSSMIPAIVSISKGAVAIEKHFTLSRSLPGIDQKASIEPNELKELVEATKQAKNSIGSSVKKRTDEENDTLKSLRRSLVAAQDLKKGTRINSLMINIKRPGTGLATIYLKKIVGLKLKKNIKKDELFKLKNFYN
jgi:N,N'-diacetyllegionaminate synthase